MSRFTSTLNSASSGILIAGPLGLFGGTVVGALKEPYVTAEELLTRVQPGDLVQFQRGIYQHYAMYKGDGWVYNISAEQKDMSEVLITVERLVDVARSNPLRTRQLVRINNKARGAAKMGLSALEASVSLDHAKNMVEEGKMQPYEFKGRNCEYYCTLWKYGRGFSDQVKGSTAHTTTSIASTVCGVVAATICGAIGGPLGAVVGYTLVAGSVGGALTWKNEACGKINLWE